MKTDIQTAEKTEVETAALALDICRLLNGMPMWQALWLVEKQVPMVLKAGHKVDVSNPDFMAQVAGAKYSADLMQRVLAKP